MVSTRSPSPKYGFSNSQTGYDRDEVCNLECPAQKNNINNCMMGDCSGKTNITANIRA